MDSIILIIRTGLMLTGIAVWVLILAVVGGVAGNRVRTWDGWQKIKDWWWVTNGGR
jgi:hypothetical protein